MALVFYLRTRHSIVEELLATYPFGGTTMQRQRNRTQLQPTAVPIKVRCWNRFRHGYHRVALTDLRLHTPYTIITIGGEEVLRNMDDTVFQTLKG